MRQAKIHQRRGNRGEFGKGTVLETWPQMVAQQSVGLDMGCTGTGTGSASLCSWKNHLSKFPEGAVRAKTLAQKENGTPDMEEYLLK